MIALSAIIFPDGLEKAVLPNEIEINIKIDESTSNCFCNII